MCVDPVPQVKSEVFDAGFLCEVDTDHSTTLNKKIRNAQLAQYNFIFGKIYRFSQYTCTAHDCFKISRFSGLNMDACARRINQICISVYSFSLSANRMFYFSSCFSYIWACIFLPVVGEKEAGNDIVNVRTRDNKVHGEHPISHVIKRFQELQSSKCLDAEEKFWTFYEISC